eukprot:13930428-Alexandrium_andersonii.AAC.1
MIGMIGSAVPSLGRASSLRSGLGFFKIGILEVPMILVSHPSVLRLVGKLRVIFDISPKGLRGQHGSRSLGNGQSLGKGSP